MYMYSIRITRDKLSVSNWIILKPITLRPYGQVCYYFITQVTLYR